MPSSIGRKKPAQTDKNKWAIVTFVKNYVVGVFDSPTRENAMNHIEKVQNNVNRKFKEKEGTR